MKTVFDNLNPTKSEVINFVEAHLRKQGKRSMENGGCAYRDKHGNSCAVGCLLDDETAATFDNILCLEGDSVANINFIVENSPIVPEHHWMRAYKNLLNDLQRLHDYSINWDENGPTFYFEDQLKSIKGKYAA